METRRLTSKVLGKEIELLIQQISKLEADLNAIRKAEEILERKICKRCGQEVRLRLGE